MRSWFAPMQAPHPLTIHHDPRRPVKLILPVLPPSAMLPAAP